MLEQAASGVWQAAGVVDERGRHVYDAIFHLEADGNESIILSVGSIVKRVKLPKRRMGGPARLVSEAVVEFGSRDSRWLARSSATTG